MGICLNPQLSKKHQTTQTAGVIITRKIKKNKKQKQQLIAFDASLQSRQNKKQIAVNLQNIPKIQPLQPILKNKLKTAKSTHSETYSQNNSQHLNVGAQLKRKYSFSSEQIIQQHSRQKSNEGKNSQHQFAFHKMMESDEDMIPNPNQMSQLFRIGGNQLNLKYKQGKYSYLNYNQYSDYPIQLGQNQQYRRI